MVFGIIIINVKNGIGIFVGFVFVVVLLVLFGSCLNVDF